LAAALDTLDSLALALVAEDKADEADEAASLAEERATDADETELTAVEVAEALLETVPLADGHN